MCFSDNEKEKKSAFITRIYQMHCGGSSLLRSDQLCTIVGLLLLVPLNIV